MPYIKRIEYISSPFLKGPSPIVKLFRTCHMLEDRSCDSSSSTCRRRNLTKSHRRSRDRARAYMPLFALASIWRRNHALRWKTPWACGGPMRRLRPCRRSGDALGDVDGDVVDEPVCVLELVWVVGDVIVACWCESATFWKLSPDIASPIAAV
jgi:hypothetical protein